MSCESERSGYLANCGSEPMVEECLDGMDEGDYCLRGCGELFRIISLRCCEVELVMMDCLCRLKADINKLPMLACRD